MKTCFVAIVPSLASLNSIARKEVQKMDCAATDWKPA